MCVCEGVSMQMYMHINSCLYVDECVLHTWWSATALDFLKASSSLVFSMLISDNTNFCFSTSCVQKNTEKKKKLG